MTMLTRPRTEPVPDPATRTRSSDRTTPVPHDPGREHQTLWYWVPRTGEFQPANHGDAFDDTLADLLASVTEDDEESVLEAFAQVANGLADTLDVTYRLGTRNGSVHAARSVGHVIERDAGGDAVRIAGITFETDTPTSTTLTARPLDLGIALETSHQGAWEWNARANIFETSEQWRTVFGYSTDDVHELLRDVANLAHPDDLQATRAALIDLMRGATERYETQQRIRHKQGHYLPCLTRARVIERDSDGRAVRLLGTHTDISALMNTQQALAETNTVLGFALEHGKQGVWEWDCETDMFKHYGHDGDRNHPASQHAITSGKTLIERTHPDDREHVVATLKAYLRGATDDYQVEQRITLNDGTYRTYLARGRALERSREGRVTRVLGSSTDITDLKANHQRLQLALENGRQGMWEWDPAIDALSFSDSWYGLFGYANGDIRNARTDFRQRIHPDDRARARAAFVALIKNECENYVVEMRLHTKTEGYTWILDRATVLERDASGRATLVVGTHVDISQQKAVEHQLEQSRRLLTHVIDTLPTFVYWKDTKSRYLGANQSFVKAAKLGSRDELIGLSDFDLPWSDDASDLQDRDQRVITNGQVVRKTNSIHLDSRGEQRLVETTKTPLLDEYGEIIGVLGIGEEVTEQRQYEKQLEKFAKHVTGVSGERLLDALTRGAVEMSGIGSAFVSIINPGGETATMVSCYPENRELLGRTYALAPSPCAQTAASGLCVYPDNVQDAYPDDPDLAALDAAGYVGRRLVDQEGSALGIIALYDSKPIRNSKHAISVIDIMAATAATELQRETREKALGDSELRYRTTFDNVPVMICTLGSDGTIIDTNNAWTVATGYPVEDTVGKRFETFFADSSRTVLAALNRADEPVEGNFGSYLDLRRIDGTPMRVSYNFGRLPNVQSGAAAIAVLEDASHKLIAEQQLRLAATAFETHEALVIRDAEKRILRVNNAFTKITGYRECDVIGKLPAHLDQGTDDSAESQIWAAVDESGEWDGERTSYRADGTTFTAWQTITAVRDDDGTITHYVENSTDVSELKSALAEARQLALFDPLTTLPNRRYLAEQLEASIAHSRRHGVKGALLFIDLDQFKHINDSHGHNVGDELLIQVAKRLKRLMRKEDTIARLGGDEFVVVLRDLGGDNDKCVEQARRVADKIHFELGKTYEVENHEFSVTPTIGVTLFPEDGKTVDTILQEADSAMYKGKADGRNTTKFFHPSMQSEAQTRLGLERDLRTAAERDELTLCFQPQYNRSGDIFAAEALLRWHHPSRGPVSPTVFIPIAEESGLILEISHWVFAAALDHLRRWERENRLFVDHVAINVSSRQFRSSNFVSEATRELVAAGVPAERVVIEVTEGTVIDNFQETARRMEKLRDIGVRFSVDDFGVGYSSLSYLSRLPLDQLKIDRSFVIDVLDDPNDAVIAETIIGMGRNLKLQTIAEGVETEAQLEFLRHQGCDGFQGFLFAPPLPEKEFLALAPAASGKAGTGLTDRRRISS